MNPRLILIIPLLIIGGLLAVIGLRLGVMVATTSETDVITHYASKYVEAFPETGQAEDCYAVPGEASGVWIVVVCSSGNPDQRREYHVNRLGGLERQVDGAATLQEDDA